jgi:hypothetical protein
VLRDDAAVSWRLQSSRPLASKIDGIVLYVDPLPRPDRVNSRMKSTN